MSPVSLLYMDCLALLSVTLFHMKGTLMGGIVWLASYPKSGNTWMRAFLQNLILNRSGSVPVNELSQFGYADGYKRWYQQAADGPLDSLSSEQVAQLTPKVQHFMAHSRPQSVFVKTHNSLSRRWGVPLITEDVTAGAIYIIRNPLDVVISLADHFGSSIDEAVDFMNNPYAAAEEDEHKLEQIYGSWSDHVNSWQNFNARYVARVRYEDLQENPAAAFAGVATFLGTRPPRKILDRAIENSSFEVLQKQEEKDGFLEKSEKSQQFFRSGKSGDWKNNLSSKQVQRIVDVHHDKMQEFGYLEGL